MTVGGEIPIPVPQTGATGVSITIEYKPFGVLLSVKPEVQPNGKIRLTVSPEVSAIDEAQEVTIAGLGVPGFNKRAATTTVDIADGGTLAIGGLIQAEEAHVVNKLPILGDLPIIGQLFRSEDFTNGDTELIILVTPQIVTEEDSADAIARSQEMRTN
jgi:pilus assembly protein CpaC